MKFTRVAVVGWVALVAVHAAACSSSSLSANGVDRDAAVADGGDVEDAAANPNDGEADATDAAPTCALPGSYGSKACNACVAARCCAFIEACENEPTCKALQACVLGCTTQPDGGGCFRGCLEVHPEAKDDWQKIDDCWFGTPPEGCLVECT